MRNIATIHVQTNRAFIVTALVALLAFGASAVSLVGQTTINYTDGQSVNSGLVTDTSYNLNVATGTATEQSDYTGPGALYKLGGGDLILTGSISNNGSNGATGGADPNGAAGSNGGSFILSSGSATFSQSVSFNGGSGGAGIGYGTVGSGYGNGGDGGNGGAFSLASGSVSFSQSISLAGGNGGNSGTLASTGANGNGGDGGTFTVSGGGMASFASGSSLNLAGGTRGSGGSGGSSGSQGTLTLSGGTLQLSTVAWLENPATFTGNFAFTSGTLRFTDTGSSINSSGILITALANSLSTGQTLEFDHAVTLSTDLALNSDSTLILHEGGTVNNNATITLNAGATLEFYLGQATSSTLDFASGTTLTGPASGLVTVNFINAGDFTAGTYDLIDGSSATLNDFSASDFVVGTNITGYDFTFAMNGSILQVTATLAAVPEPATYATLLGGLALLAAGILRRRSKAQTS